MPATHKPGLGNTGILEQALASGAVDLYPEYTGTIVRELLKREGNPSLDELNALAGAARPEGGGAVRLQQHLCTGDDRERRRSALGIARISDLFKPARSGLTLGLSHEFLERADGWPALRHAYGALPRRRSGSTTASPTTPSPPAAST